MDRQPANVVLGHQFPCVFGRVVLETANDLQRHDVARGGPFRILVFGNGSQDDVPVGNDADQPFALDDRHEADRAFAHPLRQLEQRCIRSGDLDVPHQDFADSHAVTIDPEFARRPVFEATR